MDLSILGSIPFEYSTRHPVPQMTRLSCLPFELKLNVMEYLQDIYTLGSLLEAEKSFRNVLQLYETTISTHVLQNEIPPCLYTHAIVTQQPLDDEFLMPNLQSIRIQDIATYVGKIPRARDAATSTKVSYYDAVAIHNTYLHVLELTELFMETCAVSGDQVFPDLQHSLLETKPSPSEHVRIAQAIYLFQILASMTKQLTIDKFREDLYYSDYYGKIAELQIQLTQQAVAPWEMYQVIGMKSFFMRALQGSNMQSPCDDELSLPYLMSRGIEFLCKALCHSPESTQEDFLHRYRHNPQAMPHHTLGVILSRGVADTWTRKASQPHSFAPFWPCEEDGMWEYIESQQLLVSGPMFDRLGLGNFLERIEARLDLWSAGLWDEERKIDVYESLFAQESHWAGIACPEVPELLRSMASLHRGGLWTIE